MTFRLPTVVIGLWLILLGLPAHALQLRTAALINSPSDTLTTRSWTLDDGLPVNTVNSINQDEKGFLWLTTYDGLVRFDGERFNVYDHSNTPLMPHNRTTHLHIDSYGSKWVALEYGGVIYMNERDTLHFGADNGFTTSDITQIKEGTDGQLFFNTHQGLYRFHKGRFQLIFEGSSALQRQIRDFLPTEDNTLWLATRNGLIKLDPLNDTQRIYTLEDSSFQNDFYAVHQTKKGELLVGAQSGVYTLKEGALKMTPPFANTKSALTSHIYEDEQVILFSTNRGVYHMRNGTAQLVPGSSELNNMYNTFLRDSRGTIWLVGKKGLIATYKDQKIRKFTLVDYHINDIFEDKEQNLWLATIQGGLIMLRPSLVRNIGKPEGLSGDNILALYKDSQKRYWISARSNGLNLIENGQVKPQTEIDVSSNTFFSITEDKQGRVLLGSLRNGLFRLEEGKFVHYQLSDDIDKNTVNAILPTGNDSIWVGTYNGLLLLNHDLELVKEFNLDNRLNGNKIRYLTKDSKGTLWIATMSQGLYAYKNGSFINYGVNKGMSSNNIRSIYADEDDGNTLWVGTENNGLNRIRNGIITYIAVEDGLPDHNIHWISQDSKGWLWISTNKGLAQINKSELNAYLDGTMDTFSLRLYGKQEGMRNAEGNGSFQEAGIREMGDQFWFATQEGVAIIRAGALGEYTYDPHIVIREVVANNQVFYGDSLHFGPKVNDLQVYYSGISFAFAENSRYRYKINEIHSSWIDHGNQQQLLINDLPPGTYTLTLQVSNVTGTWSPNTSSLTFTITPRFYQQWWFYLIAVFVLVGFIYLVTNLRYKRLIHKQRKLEAVINEQTQAILKEKNEILNQNAIIERQAEDLRQSNAAKDKFFSIIAHDLRNPFQAMLAYSDFLKEDFKHMSESEQRDSIEQIGIASRSLYNLVENLLVWATMQTDKISMQLEDFHFDVLVQNNVDLFRQSYEQKHITMTADIQDQIAIRADRNMADTIIRNLISNAIKFTPDDGLIEVSAYTEAEYCVFRVKDSGIGIPSKMREHLMDLGSDITRLGTHNEKGTGLGLILCNEMAQFHSGTIEVESTEGKGSTFTVRLPFSAPEPGHSETE